MELLKFKQEFIPHLKEWLEKRNLNTEVVNELPEHGYLVVENNQAICAGFIRQVEGGYGLIDSFISNPEMIAMKRHEGLNLLIDQLLSDALKRGMKQVLATTTDAHTIERALSRGFEKLPHTTIAKKVG